MDKNRFETQKEVVNLDPTVHNIQTLFSVDDLKWLIAQAEKVERYENWNAELQAELIEKDEKIEQLEQYKKVLMENSVVRSETIERYEKALKFYADKENYEEWKDVNPEVNYIHNVDFDGGDTAKKVLKNETKNLDDNEMLSFNVSFVKDIIEEIERKEKNTIATILAYVEKNHDAPEIEEYLWKMLDKGTEFE